MTIISKSCFRQNTCLTELLILHSLAWWIQGLSRTCGIKFKDFQAPVLFSSAFKALNLGEKNSSTFKDFQGCVGTLCRVSCEYCHSSLLLTVTFTKNVSKIKTGISWPVHIIPAIILLNKNMTMLAGIITGNTTKISSQDFYNEKQTCRLKICCQRYNVKPN